jgi:hypothetical protein
MCIYIHIYGYIHTYYIYISYNILYLYKLQRLLLFLFYFLVKSLLSSSFERINNILILSIIFLVISRISITIIKLTLK